MEKYKVEKTFQMHYLWPAIFLWEELVTVKQTSAKIKVEH